MMKKLILATILTATSATTFADQTMYTWDSVNSRVDGTPTENPITYILEHNGTKYNVTETSITVDGKPAPGTKSCVSAVENYPTGLKLQSEANCVAINANPSSPKFQIIQLINQSQ